jgi:hypothetical protein
MKIRIITALLFLLLGFALTDAAAQCAMCKATIESNAANQQKYGIGLNTGILYLMCIPYIAGGILFYLWYRNAKTKKTVSRLRRPEAI